MTTPGTVPVPRTYRDAVTALRAKQKTSKGAPAYSRFVNRPLGRRFAALLYVAGRTPDQVTGLSAVATFTGIALIAFAEPTVAVSLGICALLVLGYALDSADGQVARLRGGGSAAGEWLDHVVDAVKLVLLHLAVFSCWYRTLDVDTVLLLVPLVFLAVQAVFFFATILTDQLRRAHRGLNRSILAGEGTSSTLYSLAVLPTDYGVMCLAFGLLWWPEAFVLVYSLLAVGTAGFLALALPKWYREMRTFG